MAIGSSIHYATEAAFRYDLDYASHDDYLDFSDDAKNEPITLEDAAWSLMVASVFECFFFL